MDPMDAVHDRESYWADRQSRDSSLVDFVMAMAEKQPKQKLPENGRHENQNVQTVLIRRVAIGRMLGARAYHRIAQTIGER